MYEMSHDTFGIICLTSLLIFCLGLATWANWSEVKKLFKRSPPRH
ncbi:hypothetical protein PSAKL28_49740 [Pseudomonas alkylphenolica]|uniref:Uncharacterized protein n=1 Tax=Pseudomonas alkylphenolica TaxID=237609 RepID=A0A077FJ56_9PSED|nr:hypothetical protein PSAKL28_49740 [Pseudomonas alkylphenolica]